MNYEFMCCFCGGSMPAEIRLEHTAAVMAGLNPDYTDAPNPEVVEVRLDEQLLWAHRACVRKAVEKSIPLYWERE